jgi:hypothetical protein
MRSRQVRRTWSGLPRARRGRFAMAQRAMGGQRGEQGRDVVCARCAVLFFVCRRCERGQRYCGPGCRSAARHEAWRRYARRHQASEEGRADHRDRQRAYRARVTPHGRRGGAIGATVDMGAPRLGQRDHAGDHGSGAHDGRLGAIARSSSCCAVCGRLAADRADVGDGRHVTMHAMPAAPRMPQSMRGTAAATATGASERVQGGRERGVDGRPLGGGGGARDRRRR